jgi:adenine-specific DNA-methyltransferase
MKAKFLMVSFNSEGFISKDEMKCILEKIGKVNILERKYNAFRGSRNLNDRNIHVKEYLFLVEKK